VDAAPRAAPAPPRALTQATLAAGVAALARLDRDFAALVAKNGLPPMWARRPGFPTLVHIVLEQQVSIAAARTLFCRVRDHLGAMTPERVAGRGVDGLFRLGLTRQ
jgi:DNA-3-methyladenine glycosylase II